MLDILVLGATGYTGRLVTRYLATHPQRATFTFGLAARSQQKLKVLTDELGDAVHKVPTFVVDVTKADAVESVVQEARVVINAVGPYRLWGTPIVQACVRYKRHYLDLSGETPWVQEIIQKFDYAAAKSNIVIVPYAGLDSVPSDLLAYVANKTLKLFAGSSTTVDMSTSAWRLNGIGISGGTFFTVLSSLEDLPKTKLKAGLSDFAISPVRGTPATCPRAFYSLPILNPPVRGALYLMSIVNTQTVQRSRGLFELAARNPTVVFPHEISATVDMSDCSYGTTFKYEEFMVLPSRLHALLLFILVNIVGFLMVVFPPARWVARKLMPEPGQGPTDRQLEAGSVHITNITTSTPDAKGRTVSVRSTFKGKGEPGYLLSSIIISEAALALVLNKDSLPPFGRRGGVLTPMTAFGDILIQRLNACGRISIESEVLPSGYEAKKIR
ncbi:Saccharopine dehydrogenase-domain-containing protein [Scleroderma yunnanense]